MCVFAEMLLMVDDADWQQSLGSQLAEQSCL
jgi:hypothetical protein